MNTLLLWVYIGFCLLWINVFLNIYFVFHRSLCCKVSVNAGAVCLLILILGLAIGIPVAHKKGKIELPKGNKIFLFLLNTFIY